MRPFGDIAQELLSRAGTPSTVRSLCEQAKVGYTAGRYTASRLVDRGALVVVGRADASAQARVGRPASLVVAASALPKGVAASPAEAQDLVSLPRSFWEREPHLVGD